jgi:tripartite-type tricarboxylate transporter receptor subunit TctC
MILAFSFTSLSEIIHGARQLDKWTNGFFGVFFCLLAMQASGQDFPARPIRIIVPLAAGGTGDTLARLLAEEMAKPLGMAVIIDNRPGSGGIIGTDAVAKSAPDGYTLLHTSSSHVMQPALRPQLPYDAIRDFAVIARTADTHQVLLANPAFPPASVKELLSYAKTQRVFYGSAGNGSATHLHMELLKSLTGIELDHVPYKGSTQARTDLLAGQIQLAFDGLLPNLPHIRAGKLKALGLASSHRSPAAPEIPTLAQAGVPGYQSDTWYALFAPAGVSSPVLELLRTTAQQALKGATLRGKLLQQGAEPTEGTPAELETLMRAELARWTKLVSESHIKVD